MKVSKKELTALAAGCSVGGVVLKAIDADNVGADDRVGQALTIAAPALTAAASSDGASVGKNEQAARACDVIGDAFKGLAAELRGGG